MSGRSILALMLSMLAGTEREVAAMKATKEEDTAKRQAEALTSPGSKGRGNHGVAILFRNRDTHQLMSVLAANGNITSLFRCFALYGFKVNDPFHIFHPLVMPSSPKDATTMKRLLIEEGTLGVIARACVRMYVCVKE